MYIKTHSSRLPELLLTKINKMFSFKKYFLRKKNIRLKIPTNLNMNSIGQKFNLKSIRIFLVL